MYGDVPSWLWLEAIDELTDEQVMHGLRKLRDRGHDDYPANCTEFVDACKPRRAGRRYGGVPITPAELSLPKPDVDRDFVDERIASMRRALAQGDVTVANRRPPLPVANPELLEGCTCKAAGTCEICTAWRRALPGALAK